MTNGGGWARQGWGIVIVVGTAVALLPWFGFGLHTIVVADSCTEASETYQRLSMVPTVIAVGLPIAFVLSLRKRSPVAYIVVAFLLIGLAAFVTWVLWRDVTEPYSCD